MASCEDFYKLGIPLTPVTLKMLLFFDGPTGHPVKTGVFRPELRGGKTTGVKGIPSFYKISLRRLSISTLNYLSSCHIVLKNLPLRANLFDVFWSWMSTCRRPIRATIFRWLHVLNVLHVLDG